LSNLAENYSASELVENSLAQNKKKTLNILNENNFSNDDCILILRIYLNKLKRLLRIQSDIKETNNIDQSIADYKPPIFWKDKDLVKQQIKIWRYEKIRNLITNTNNLELQIKENPSVSILLLTNFILEKTLNSNNSF
jgi:DNA polymerase-3 subunit delta